MMLIHDESLRARRIKAMREYRQSAAGYEPVTFAPLPACVSCGDGHEVLVEGKCQRCFEEAAALTVDLWRRDEAARLATLDQRASHAFRSGVALAIAVITGATLVVCAVVMGVDWVAGAVDRMAWQVGMWWGR